MIASARGLVVLSALAVGLGVAVIAGAPEQVSAVDRTLLDEKVLGAAQRIEIVHPGAPPIVLVAAEKHWKLEDGSVAYVATTDALTSALTGARWHRRASIDSSWPPGDELRVGSETFRRGPALPGTDQTWIAHRGSALLVDTWVARALFPDALALRDRRPLSDAAAAQGIVGPGVRFEERHQLEPIVRWISDEAYVRLAEALAAVELVSLDGIKTGPAGRAIELLGGKQHVLRSVREAGTCDGGRIYVTSKDGSGCVEAAAWSAALAAFEPFTKEDPALVDRRLVPFAPGQVTYPDGTSLDLVSMKDDLDPDRVAMMHAALRSSGDIVGKPTGTPRSTLVVKRGESQVTLEIFDKVVVRAGESFALKVPGEIHAFLLKPPSALKSTTRWREDVTTLSSLKLDGITYTRGQVIGEWTRTPAGTVDVSLVDALAESLASVRGVPADAPSKIAHRISVTFTPPVGGSTTHTLELGPGCDARVDGTGVRLDLPLCLATAALAGSH